MNKSKYKLAKDPLYGYLKLTPTPKAEDLNKFYKHSYYKLIRNGGRAPEIKRLMSRGKEMKQEKSWLAETFYSDICFALHKYSSGKRILDVGCGNGDLLDFLDKKGFKTVGIEPSGEAVRKAQSKGLSVYGTDLCSFTESRKSGKKEKYDAVLLMNVLEHVPEPLKAIKIAKKLLVKNGILCIKVPNDFSAFQLAAEREIRKKSWWVAIPDHVNYFNFKSLFNILKSMKFNIVYSQGDFPMELFLLMGEDYVRSPAIGRKCHQKRQNFELALPGDLRRTLYQALATFGIGRECFIVGRRHD